MAGILSKLIAKDNLEDIDWEIALKEPTNLVL